MAFQTTDNGHVMLTIFCWIYSKDEPMSTFAFVIRGVKKSSIIWCLTIFDWVKIYQQNWLTRTLIWLKSLQMAMAVLCHFFWQVSLKLIICTLDLQAFDWKAIINFFLFGLFLAINELPLQYRHQYKIGKQYQYKQ